jgi:hypothetical protein
MTTEAAAEPRIHELLLENLLLHTLLTAKG